MVCPVQDAAARWIGRACKLADVIAHPQGCRVAGPGFAPTDARLPMAAANGFSRPPKPTGPV